MADQEKGPIDEGRRRERPGWEATTHLAYREWANEALGDERQVYARSTAGEGGELVFMPEGGAEEFRAAAQAGRLVCPVPGCPSPRLTTRGPAERRHHFVHRQAPPDPAHQRAYERQVATELLADWIRATHPKSTVETNVPVGEVSVTVLVTGPGGAKFAVVFVDRRIGVDAWWDEDLELERAGMARGWIFAPRRYLRYPEPAADAGPEDPAVRDRRRGDVVLDRALFREMRAFGQWPLLLNINRREVANLIAPNGRVARGCGSTRRHHGIACCTWCPPGLRSVASAVMASRPLPSAPECSPHGDSLPSARPSVRRPRRRWRAPRPVEISSSARLRTRRSTLLAARRMASSGVG